MSGDEFQDFPPKLVKDVHSHLETLSPETRCKVLAALISSECGWMAADLESAKNMVNMVADIANEALDAMQREGETPWQMEATGVKLYRRETAVVRLKQ